MKAFQRYNLEKILYQTIENAIDDLDDIRYDIENSTTVKYLFGRRELNIKVVLLSRFDLFTNFSNNSDTLFVAPKDVDNSILLRLKLKQVKRNWTPF